MKSLVDDEIVIEPLEDGSFLVTLQGRQRATRRGWGELFSLLLSRRPARPANERLTIAVEADGRDLLLWG